MATQPCSAIILAGGQSKRFNGTNKALLKVGGVQILDRMLAVIKPFFDEIILVTTEPETYLGWDLLIVSDHFDCRSSLTGIHAGLFAASHPHAMVMGCDMPFVQPALVACLLQLVEPKLDVVIPKTKLGVEPLMAVYSKLCLKPIEEGLNRGQYQIQQFFRQVRVKAVEEEQLRSHDPDLVSLFNVNSPRELGMADKWLENGQSLSEPQNLNG